MQHLVPKEPQTDQAGYYKARCGRYVRPNQSTTALTTTECAKCREAFARLLRSLPNVIEEAQA